MGERITTSFTAYIDESGDEGFVFLPGERGSSRWLVLSAVVFRKSKDPEAVRVMREVRALLGKDPKKALHFREMKHKHRLPYVRALAAAPFGDPRNGLCPQSGAPRDLHAPRPCARDGCPHQLVCQPANARVAAVFGVFDGLAALIALMCVATGACETERTNLPGKPKG